jgi:nucleotide-binding universal stress UspA family protein
MNNETLPNAPSDASAVRQPVGAKEIDRPIAYGGPLVPIDFSDHSKKTIEYAAQLAALTGASIKVLHILQIPEYPRAFIRGFTSNPTCLSVSWRRQTRTRTNRSRKVIGEILAKGLQAQSMLRVWNAYEEIVSVANEMDVGLIVIGSHGYRGLGRLLLSSTAERVLQYAPYAVLVVKDVPVASPPAKIAGCVISG